MNRINYGGMGFCPPIVVKGLTGSQQKQVAFKLLLSTYMYIY